jgi:hypothetical protein
MPTMSVLETSDVLPSPGAYLAPVEATLADGRTKIVYNAPAGNGETQIRSHSYDAQGDALAGQRSLTTAEPSATAAKVIGIVARSAGGFAVESQAPGAAAGEVITSLQFFSAGSNAQGTAAVINDSSTGMAAPFLAEGDQSNVDEFSSSGGALYFTPVTNTGVGKAVRFEQGLTGTITAVQAVRVSPGLMLAGWETVAKDGSETFTLQEMNGNGHDIGSSTTLISSGGSFSLGQVNLNVLSTGAVSASWVEQQGAAYTQVTQLLASQPGPRASQWTTTPY